MAKYKITFHNGYVTCDNEEIIEADSLADAEEYAAEAVYDYGESYEHVATGYGNDWESEEEREDYYENLEYSVEEYEDEDEDEDKDE